MMLNDRQIKDWCITDPPMIEPFVDHLVTEDLRTRAKILSVGLGSAGYDIQLSKEFRRVAKTTTVLDPRKYVDSQWYTEITDDCVILNPGEFVLARSLEYFRMPDNIVGIAYPKSSYLRVGLHVPISPLEPGWEGNLTIQIRNSGSAKVAVFPFQGIAQITFHKIARPATTYRDRQGKYQGQTGVTHAR